MDPLLHIIDLRLLNLDMIALKMVFNWQTRVSWSTS